MSAFVGFEAAWLYGGFEQHGRKWRHAGEGYLDGILEVRLKQNLPQVSANQNAQLSLEFTCLGKLKVVSHGGFDWFAERLCRVFFLVLGNWFLAFSLQRPEFIH